MFKNKYSYISCWGFDVECTADELIEKQKKEIEILKDDKNTTIVKATDECEKLAKQLRVINDERKLEAYEKGIVKLYSLFADEKYVEIIENKDEYLKYDKLDANYNFHPNTTLGGLTFCGGVNWGGCEIGYIETKHKAEKVLLDIKNEIKRLKEVE